MGIFLNQRLQYSCVPAVKMPFRDREREVGVDNKKLLHLARHTAIKSPPLRQEVALFDEINAVKDKEFVGLGFNRYVHDSLKDRWIDLEHKQAAMREDILEMQDYVMDDDFKVRKAIKQAAQDRIQILLLGNKIRQLEGLTFILCRYFDRVKEIIKYYEPCKAFMRQCADRMHFVNEMQIIDRYKTLSIVKEEMVQTHMTSFEALEKERERFIKVKTEKENDHLKAGSDLNALIEKCSKIEKANLEFESKLANDINQASEHSRSTFRVASGVRRLYESIMEYRGLEATSCDPFEMLSVIENKFQNLSTAMTDLYHLHEMQMASGKSLRRKLRSSEHVVSHKQSYKKSVFDPKLLLNINADDTQRINKFFKTHKTIKIKTQSATDLAMARKAGKHVRISVPDLEPLSEHSTASDKAGKNHSVTTSEKCGRKHSTSTLQNPNCKHLLRNKSDNFSDDFEKCSSKKLSRVIDQNIPAKNSIRLPKIKNSSSGSLQRPTISVNKNASSLSGPTHYSKLNTESRMNSSTDSSEGSLLRVDRKDSSWSVPSHISGVSNYSSNNSPAISSCRSKFTVKRKAQVHWR